MGILNLSQDSFYDGGHYNTEKKIIAQSAKMLNEGASFIDIGTFSSRPGARAITAEQELELLIPVIKLLVKEFPEILISVDTYRSEVASKAIENGASIINDISAGKLDASMFDTIAQLQVPYIMMHMLGTPKNMQNNPTYVNVVNDLLTFFAEKLADLKTRGVNDIIIDVGFGFGKSLEHNYELLQNLSLFEYLSKPLLVGLSRKSMLYQPLKTNPDQALNATTVVHTIALINGARILRVHDVKEAMEAIHLVGLLNTEDLQ
jgi:dihydropteroate synthase